MTIRLKCWGSSFDAIASGSKRCTIRRADDRSFSEGDFLLLIRTNDLGDPTGGWLRARVTWITEMAGPLQLRGVRTDANDWINMVPLVVLSLDLMEYSPGAAPSE